MPAPKRYPDELRERAARMVFEMRERTGQRKGALARVGEQLGINPETLRLWVKQAQIDTGQRDGLTTEEKAELTRLRRENRVLRMEKEILGKAAAFFATENGHRPS